MFHLFVLIGPSGVGKTTLATRISTQLSKIKHVITYTTRLPRKSEVNDIDYHFVNEYTFRQMRNNDEFFEWTIINDCYYGIKWDDINTVLSNKIIIVDINGAKKIKKILGDESKLIFVSCKNINETLKNRLEKRGEPKTWIQKRMKHSMDQIDFYKNNPDFFDYHILNDNLELSLEQLSSIIGHKSII